MVAQEGEMGPSMPPGSIRAYEVAAHWRERGRGEMGIELGLRGELYWALGRPAQGEERLRLGRFGPEEVGLALFSLPLFSFNRKTIRNKKKKERIRENFEQADNFPGLIKMSLYREK